MEQINKSKVVDHRFVALIIMRNVSWVFKVCLVVGIKCFRIISTLFLPTYTHEGEAPGFLCDQQTRELNL